MKNKMIRTIGMVFFFALFLSYLGVESVLAEVRYSEIRRFNEGMCAVKKSGKYGFIDKTGKEVIPCIYDEVSYFNEGLAGVKKDDKNFFIDKTGKKVLDSKYEAYLFKDGFAELRQMNEEGTEWLRGYMNREGKVIIEPKYVEITHVGNKFYVENEKNLAGILDERGKVIIPEKYNRIQEESEGLISVYKLDDSFCVQGGLIDKKGKEVIKLKYEYAGNLKNGRIPVQGKDGKWFLLDKKGRQVGKKLSYEYVEDFLGNYAFVRDKNGKWGMIDRSGKEVMKCKYDEKTFFSEGLIAVRTGGERAGKWGFINEKGKEVIKQQYDYYADLEYYYFLDGLATVSKNAKVGFIDKKGKTVIPFKYDEAKNFINGFAKVRLNGKEGVIDKKGREVVPCRYEEAEYCPYEKIFQVRTKKEVHLLNQKGKFQKKFILSRADKKGF